MSPSRIPADRRYAQDGKALFLPFMLSPEMVHMGLNRLDTGNWIQPCASLPHYLHNKLRARRRLGERVYTFLPRSLPAQRELRSLLLRHLCRDHARHYSAAAGCLHWQAGGAALRWPLHGAEPLWCTSQWIADDLCLLEAGERGYELTAASLSAPSYWRLEEKIGRPLDLIHAPVPGLAHKIGARVARFFDHLLPDHPVWRGNWSVVTSPELLQRGGGEVQGSHLYLRVERQSLRRLPRTGAVVFGIRVTINPLADILPVPGAPAALKRAVRQLSPQESRYKSLAPLLPALEDFLFASTKARY